MSSEGSLKKRPEVAVALTGVEMWQHLKSGCRGQRRECAGQCGCWLSPGLGEVSVQERREGAWSSGVVLR